MRRIGYIILLVAVSAFALVSVAEGERTVIDGVTYVCEDGVCRIADDEPVRVTPAASPKARVAQGMMSESEFVAFLEGGEQRSPFAGKTALALALAILLGGLLLNLTPCVLPMIPVNLLIIGKSLLRACVFASGIALGYGALGIAAALFGAATSGFASDPIFNLFVAVIFAVLALAQFGVFDLHLLRGKAGVAKGRSVVGVFVMGLLSAALAGACIAPVLVAVMTLTAERVAAGQSLAIGYPFLLGLGLALPWPFLGAGLKVLPKPGMWMAKVNRVLGVLVLALAVWYGWQGACGGWVRWGFGESKASESQTVEAFDLEKLPKDKPVLVDCWASWCKNCGAMDDLIKHSPSVQDALKRFHFIKLQAEDLRALQAKPGFESVKGLPAFVIFE